MVQAQTLTDSALGVLNLVVYFFGGKVYESGRQVRDQRLKAKALI